MIASDYRDGVTDSVTRFGERARDVFLAHNTHLFSVFKRGV